MGWTELLLIGVVALIVVGPKDLPVMFQSLGRMTAKVKRMAREFQNAMEDAADSTGVKDVAKDLNKSMSPKSMGIDKLRDAADRFDKWDPTKSDTGSETKKLAEDREEAKRKIQSATAKAAEERKAREAAAADAEAAELADEPEPVSPRSDADTMAESSEQPVNKAKPAPTRKTATARKSTTRKPAATGGEEKKPAAKSAAGKSGAKPSATRSKAAKTGKKAPTKRKSPVKSEPKPAASGDAEMS